MRPRHRCDLPARQREPVPLHNGIVADGEVAEEGHQGEPHAHAELVHAESREEERDDHTG